MNNGDSIAQAAAQTQVAPLNGGTNELAGAREAATGTELGKDHVSGAPSAGATQPAAAAGHSAATAAPSPAKPSAAQAQLDQRFGAPFLVYPLDARTAKRVDSIGVRCVDVSAYVAADPFGYLASADDRATLRTIADGAETARPDPLMDLAPGLLAHADGHAIVVLATRDPSASVAELHEQAVAAQHLAHCLVVQSRARSVRQSTAALPSDQAFAAAAAGGVQDDPVASMPEDLSAIYDAEPMDPQNGSSESVSPAPAGSLAFLFDQIVQPPLGAGYLFNTTYTEGWIDGEQVELRVRRRHARPTDRHRPVLDFESIVSKADPMAMPAKKGAKAPMIKTVEWKSVAAPFLHRQRTLVVAPMINGRLEANDPRQPPTVYAEFKGVTDDGRTVRLVQVGDLSAGYLAKIGFSTTSGSYEAWKEAERARASIVPRVMATDAMGWVQVARADGSFDEREPAHYVHGDQVFTPQGARALMAVRADKVGRGSSKSGTFDGWRKVAQLIMRNPMMSVMFGLAASSALFTIVQDMEAMFVVAVADSGVGKTAMARAVATMVGAGPRTGDTTQKSVISSWSGTENGALATTLEWNHCIQIKDEIDEAKCLTPGVVYAMVNGSGKLRADIDGSAKAAKVGRCHTVTVGEAFIETKFAQGARTARDAEMTGGLQLRCVQFDAATLWTDVAEQTKAGGYGVYDDFVKEHGEIGATVVPAARIVDTLVDVANANHGHFWGRWIEFLQTAEGREKVQQWVAEGNEFVSTFVDAKNDSAVARRRSKNVVTVLTGLRGVLELCAFPDAVAKTIYEQAQAAARDHFWLAGLDSRNNSEAEDFVARAEAWILNNEGRFFSEGRPSLVEGNLGWLNPVDSGGDGACCLMDQGKETLAKALGVDERRLMKALLSAGWEKVRGVRHPLQSRTSPAPRILRKKGFFGSRRNPAENNPTDEEVSPNPHDKRTEAERVAEFRQKMGKIAA
ncbi:DUF927 domain-containing protein [Burkholderia vietnamiensis]|uniref:DUF927 domain-containing protein n=1 Tax=Burkholderia vietnamiensis (strain G4 / LMG 22486) TaxID=269482 RepID=A4JFH1_BURVG|nr:hypothetical protein Bcep1808_2022 [Burkholderia vietnamiensis G4]MCB4344783.1 DUF927 domain-containing protein [Burkholderia vietnamiensis]